MEPNVEMGRRYSDMRVYLGFSVGETAEALGSTVALLEEFEDTGLPASLRTPFARLLGQKQEFFQKEWPRLNDLPLSVRESLAAATESGCSEGDVAEVARFAGMLEGYTLPTLLLINGVARGL